MGLTMALRVHGERAGLEAILAQQEQGRVFRGFDDRSSDRELGDDLLLYFAGGPSDAAGSAAAAPSAA